MSCDNGVSLNWATTRWIAPSKSGTALGTVPDIAQTLMGRVGAGALANERRGYTTGVGTGANFTWIRTGRVGAGAFANERRGCCTGVDISVYERR